MGYFDYGPLLCDYLSHTRGEVVTSDTVARYVRLVSTPQCPMTLPINGRPLPVACSCVQLRNHDVIFIFRTSYADAYQYSVVSEITATQLRLHFHYDTEVHRSLRRSVFASYWSFLNPMHIYDFMSRPRCDSPIEARMRLMQTYNSLSEASLGIDQPLLEPLTLTVR